MVLPYTIAINSLTLGRTRGAGLPLSEVLPSFFLEDETSAPDVFSSSSFIPRTHFEQVK